MAPLTSLTQVRSFGASPSIAVFAVRRKFATDTPGTSTGYCIARNRPARARSSTVIVEHVLAVEGDRAAGDLVLRVAGDRVRQRRLAGAVRAHDRVRLAGPHGQVDAARGSPSAPSSVSTETCRSRISRVAHRCRSVLQWLQRVLDVDETSSPSTLRRGRPAPVRWRAGRSACRCAGRSASRAASTRSRSRRPRPRTARSARASTRRGSRRPRPSRARGDLDTVDLDRRAAAVLGDVGQRAGALEARHGATPTGSVGGRVRQPDVRPASSASTAVSSRSLDRRRRRSCG